MPPESLADCIEKLLEKIVRLQNPVVSCQQTRRDWTRYAEGGMEFSWSRRTVLCNETNPSETLPGVGGSLRRG